MDWRSTTQQVLQLNDAEMAIIEKLLIQNEQLQYIDHGHKWLIASDLSQQYCFDEVDMMLSDWFNESKAFIYS